MTNDMIELDEKGLEAAAKAAFAKANEGNLKPETIESLWQSQHLPHWQGLAQAAIRAYLATTRSALPVGVRETAENPIYEEIVRSRSKELHQKPIHRLPDGRQFISDIDVLEMDCLDFIRRFDNYWCRDEQRCGWTGPLPQENDR